MNYYMESQMNSLAMLGLSASLNIIVTAFIVMVLCRKKLICNFNKPSLLLFNILIFIFCTILMRLDISMGMGVGLFAVLAMFRFRSEVLKTQEMFYLLLLIAIGFVHAAFPKVLGLTEVLFVDISLLGLSYFLSVSTSVAHPKFKISLDKLQLIQPNNEEKLHAYLLEKTGYTMSRIEIIHVDLKKGRAHLLVQPEEYKNIEVTEKNISHETPTFDLKKFKELAIPFQAKVS